MPSRKRVKSKTKPEEPITPDCGFFSVNSVYSSKKRKLMDWSFAFRNSCRQRRSALLRRTDKLSRSVVGFFGRAAGVKFRLRTMVSARRHLATRQCHNKHANWWEFVNSGGARQGMRQRSLGKGTGRGDGLGSSGDEPRRHLHTVGRAGLEGYRSWQRR